MYCSEGHTKHIFKLDSSQDGPKSSLKRLCQKVVLGYFVTDQT